MRDHRQIAINLTPIVRRDRDGPRTSSRWSAPFRGWAVGCNYNWTYSWRLRYYTGGAIFQWKKENFRYTTSFSSPTYTEPNPYQYKSDCVKFFVNHSRTIGQNKVDEAQDRLGAIGRGVNSRDLPEDGPVTEMPGSPPDSDAELQPQIAAVR